MSGQSKTSQSLIAAFAALMMSAVTVGAAIAPAQAFATPVTDAIEVNLYA